MSASGQQKSEVQQAHSTHFQFKDAAGKKSLVITESPFEEPNREPHSPRLSSSHHFPHHRGATVTAQDATQIARTINPEGWEAKTVHRPAHHFTDYVDHVKTLRDPLSKPRYSTLEIDRTDLPEQLKLDYEKSKSS